MALQRPTERFSTEHQSDHLYTIEWCHNGWAHSLSCHPLATIFTNHCSSQHFYDYLSSSGNKSAQSNQLVVQLVLLCCWISVPRRHPVFGRFHQIQKLILWHSAAVLLFVWIVSLYANGSPQICLRSRQSICLWAIWPLLCQIIWSFPYIGDRSLQTDGGAGVKCIQMYSH